VAGFVVEKEKAGSRSVMSKAAFAYSGGTSLRWNAHRFISLSVNIDSFFYDKAEGLESSNAFIGVTMERFFYQQPCP
jgi:hypothetical protein